MSKFCMYCGSQLVDDAKFCSTCGKKQSQFEVDERIDNTSSTDVAEQINDISTIEVAHPSIVNNGNSSVFSPEESSQTSKKSKRNLSASIIVRNSILLAAALVLFVLSFAPIYKERDEDFTIQFSPLNQIVFLFDSLKSESEEDLKESALSEEIQDLLEEVYEETDEDGELTARGERLQNKFFILVYRLTVQSEDYQTGLIDIIPAIASIIYILLTLAFLVLASLNFASSFGLMNKSRAKIYSYTVKMLATIPGFILVLYSTSFAFWGYRNSCMAWGGVASLIISLIVIITITTLAFIFKWHNKKFNIPLRSIASIMSVLVICMTLTPILNSSVKATFDGRTSKSTVEIPVYVSIFSEFNFDDEDWNSIEDLRDISKLQVEYYIESLFNDFEDYTKSEIIDGEADDNNNHILVTSLGIDAPDEVIYALSFIPLLYFVIAFLASMVLTQNLRCFMDGTYSRIQARIGKISSLIVACITLAVIIVTFVFFAEAIYRYAPKNYSIYFGAGIIFLIVFAITSCALPSEKK